MMLKCNLTLVICFSDIIKPNAESGCEGQRSQASMLW